ncbi:hypothetical protein QTP88_007264 [Uroleucon formosanum]
MNLQKTKKTHKHKQVETVKIKIQEVDNERKSKAFNDNHEPARKIIRKEMSSIEKNTVIRSNYVSLIRKSMYYERRKHLPTLPKSLEDALNFVSNYDILTCQNEKMTYELLQVLNINIIHLNFVKAAHNDIQKTFTEVKVTGGRFHFGQALWRKTQSINSLRRSYNDNANETVHKVTELFVDLMSICLPRDVCTEFGD